MLIFSPHVAFPLEAFVHLYAAKNVLFSIQSNEIGQFGDPAIS